MHVNIIQSCIKYHVFVFNLYALCLPVVYNNYCQTKKWRVVFVYLFIFFFKHFSTVFFNIDQQRKLYTYFSILFMLNVLWYFIMRESAFLIWLVITVDYKRSFVSIINLLYSADRSSFKFSRRTQIVYLYSR